MSSRNETLIKATINGQSANDHVPISRMEELLKQLNQKVISSGNGSELYLDVSQCITETTESSGTITQEAFNLIQTKINNGEIIGINIGGIPIKYSYTDEYNPDGNGVKSKLIFIHNFRNIANLKMIIDENLTCYMEQEMILNIPPLPGDAETKTYTLKSVNGILTWSE